VIFVPYTDPGWPGQVFWCLSIGFVHSTAGLPGIKSVVEREFFTPCDIVKRIENNSPGIFAQRGNIGLERMIDEA